MRKLKVILLSKKTIFLSFLALIIFFSVLVLTSLFLMKLPANIFPDPRSGVIVIDAGHGGIDGGASHGGVMEKEVNLDISKKLKIYFKQRGYKTVLTREEDVSLDGLSRSGRSRHQRDLNARVGIINNNNAQLFLSIHVNSNMKNPNANGSIVFYNDKYLQNKTLAYCIQRSLNNMIVDGKKRTVHDPQKADYYLLGYSKIPGVIIETAFVSNAEEQRLLMKDEFRDEIAKAIANGIDKYFEDQSQDQIRNVIKNRK